MDKVEPSGVKLLKAAYSDILAERNQLKKDNDHLASLLDKAKAAATLLKNGGNPVTIFGKGNEGTTTGSGNIICLTNVSSARIENTMKVLDDWLRNNKPVDPLEDSTNVTRLRTTGKGSLPTPTPTPAAGEEKMK